MRKITFIAVAAAALIAAGIAGWVKPSLRSSEAKASGSIETQIDVFSAMSSAKNLPAQEFEDFSLVFSSPVPKSVTP